MSVAAFDPKLVPLTRLRKGEDRTRRGRFVALRESFNRLTEADRKIAESFAGGATGMETAIRLGLSFAHVEWRSIKIQEQLAPEADSLERTEGLAPSFSWPDDDPPDVDHFPVERKNCRPCGTCQGWRDTRVEGVVEYADDRLKCGHTLVEAFNHSRPCVWARCSLNLYQDTDKFGRMTLAVPRLEIWEMRQTCVQDLADRGHVTHEEIGQIYKVSRQSIQQLEDRAKRKAKLAGDAEE